MGEETVLELATAITPEITELQRRLKAAYLNAWWLVRTVKKLPRSAWWISKTGSKKVKPFLAKITQGDLGAMKELLESGKVKPVIDRRYPLSDVAEALRYLEEGHAQGKVVITVKQGNDT